MPCGATQDGRDLLHIGVLGTASQKYAGQKGIGGGGFRPMGAEEIHAETGGFELVRLQRPQCHPRCNGNVYGQKSHPFL